ncbi:hybrid sensor histidine kinase/response regulator transcription factor [Plebeiibacterium marinum]|uniref:histidine kinase n=1 Tax=Plebeiibacterium marinum TaxID=2992111 RepID=A0AAE3MDA8_9BACT|nr:two-component regulator propeller domain-containing protein [Plebeiobacterium marinum]MCW3805482.1 response regulator [Plebeiobacterium marinum]
MKKLKQYTLVVLIFLALGTNLLSNSLFFEKIEGLPNMPNTPIHGIVKDSIGYIWFGTENGLYRFNGLDFELYINLKNDSTTIPENRIRNIILDKEEQLWVLDFNNLYTKYNYSSNNFIRIPGSHVNNAVKEKLNSRSFKLNYDKVIKDHRFYLSNHHFSSINIKTQKAHTYFSNYKKPGCLTEDYITSFYIDNQDFIWIGTREGSIYKVDSKRKPFDYNLNFKAQNKNTFETSVRAILKTDEELWLASNHSGISVYRDGELQLKHPYYNSNNKQRQVRVLTKDHYGNIWIGGVDGLGMFDNKNQIKVPVINKETKPEFNRWSVYCLAESDSGFIWAGVFNKLVRINVQTHETTYIYLTELIGEHSITAIHQDRKGNIWLGTEGSGLIRLKRNAEGEIKDTVILSDDVVIGNRIYALYEDKQGTIWVGTSEGVSAINPNNLSHKGIYSLNQNKPCYISSITGDNAGNIWVTHKEGLFKIELKNNFTTHYNLGTHANDWVFLNGASFNDKDSILYFGAREGYVKFQPNNIRKDNLAPKLFLSSLSVAGIKIEPQTLIDGNAILEHALFKTKNIRLSNKNRNFSLEMIAFYYQNPNGVKYYYQLDGIDDSWQETKENKVAYKKIPPGNYVFKAKALSPDGIWSDEKQLKIFVSSPWYATTHAIIIYIVLVLSVLYLIYFELKAREKLKNKILLERLNAEKNEEINTEKLEFFTNVSHELRTPLTLITDPVKQLKSTDISLDKKRLYIDIIDRNVTHLTSLINQILDFRKTEAGKIKLNYEIKDGIKIIYETMKTFDAMANQRQIELNFSTNFLTFIGLFDEDKLKKIVLNIISNSFKYTPDKGIVNVDVTINQEETQLKIKISDNGVGISKNKLNKVFDPFNSIGTKPFQGSTSGMGLALTKKWIEQLNGKIDITSQHKKGTAVTITLPVRGQNDQIGKEVDELVDENMVGGEYIDAIDDSKTVILIVEDNQDILSYLNQELKKDNSILMANNGLEGLDLAFKHIPDIIITDVMMPEMDGIEMCSKIKNDEKTSHIPVIMLTAKTSSNSQVEGLKTGADVYIPKPFNIEVIKAQVESIIQNRKRLQEKLAGRKFASQLKESINPIDSAFLNKANKAIEENLGKPGFKQEDLARLLRISTRQLSRKVKATTGNTVHEYITKVRMEKASDLLLNSNLNITEIAFELGFSEQSNFSRSFSKYFGCSPSKYKEQPV